MKELDQAIATAFANQGKPEDVNKVYLLFLQSPMFLPVKKTTEKTIGEEPFHPLYAVFEEKYFMLAFDELERLTHWAKEQITQIDYVELTGRDLIAGINENVYLVINIGTDFHKEFSPEEVIHLKKIVGKLDQLKNG